MKYILFISVILLIVSCRNESTIKPANDTIHSKSDTFKKHKMNNIIKQENKSIRNDTLQIVAKITHMLPIGWGTKYKCEVQKITMGSVNILDSTFVMGIGINENIIKTDDIDILLLKIKECYSIGLKNSGLKTSNDNHVSPGRNVIDKNGIIWNIIAINKYE